MSKRINNYKGRHHGWKQRRYADAKPEKKKTGVSPIHMMWMNFIVKSRAFQKARDTYRAALNVKGKKALTGKKRQVVLDKFFAVRY